MKTTLQYLGMALAGMLALPSCSNDLPVAYDAGAQDFMDQSSFLVEAYDVYNHDRSSTLDLTQQYDSIYMTFDGANLYLTRVSNGPASGSQSYYQFDTLSADFSGGAFLGIWMDAHSKHDIEGFERRDNVVGFECYGRNADGNTESRFVRMQKLDNHPKGAQIVSGLPG
jgi:hypothetical protein